MVWFDIARRDVQGSKGSGGKPHPWNLGNLGILELRAPASLAPLSLSEITGYDITTHSAGSPLELPQLQLSLAVSWVTGIGEVTSQFAVRTHTYQPKLENSLDTHIVIPCHPLSRFRSRHKLTTCICKR